MAGAHDLWELTGLTALDIPVLFLIHPRTRVAAHRAGLTPLLERLHTIDPVGHTELLELASRATLLVPDSGGLQEEATVLGRPLLVVRRSTERPESIAAGFARLVTPDDDIRAVAHLVLASADTRELSKIGSPYGDRHASERIARIATRIADGWAPATAVSAEKREAAAAKFAPLLEGVKCEATMAA